MDEKKEKSEKIVKSIKVLEGVLKTSPSAAQRSRVNKDIAALRDMLKEMYPNTDVQALEDAIYSDSLLDSGRSRRDFSEFETLKDIELVTVSNFRSDEEINLAASILRHLENYVWGAVADQHAKLDFSNSGIRDTLYRKLDQCNRSLRMFTETIADIDKAKSSEYGSQLQMMRQKQARVFLFDFVEFLNDAKLFISSLVADAEFGGSMVLNAEEKIVYADYEKYRMFDDWSVLEALQYLKKFLTEVIEFINVPDLKKTEKPRKLK